jgi:hypothetical protein
VALDVARIVADVLALRHEAFAAALADGRAGLRLGLLVVFLAGLSVAVGQSVILFAHRVSPRRFAATLLVQALLFLAAFVTWSAAVWFVAGTFFGSSRPLSLAIAAIGLAYAPQLLSFFVLTPYFGTPIGTVLSVWSLLATLMATAVAFDLAVTEAAAAAGLGWLLAQALQRTVGRPIVRIGRAVRHAVAGVDVRARPPT